MNDPQIEMFSAFVDGEPIDPSAFAAALAEPGAREALVDLVALRAAAADPGAAPSSEFYTAARRAGLIESPALAVGRGRGLRAAVLAAAAMLLLSLGVTIAVRWRADRPPVPPEPTREVSFVEGVDWFRG